MSVACVAGSQFGLAVSVDSRVLRYVEGDGSAEVPRDISLFGTDSAFKMQLVHARFIVAPLGTEPRGTSLIEIIDRVSSETPRRVKGHDLAVALVHAFRKAKALKTILVIVGFDFEGPPVVIKALVEAGRLEYRNYPEGRPGAGEPMHGLWTFGHDDVIRRLVRDVEVPFTEMALQDLSDLTRFCIYSQSELQRFALLEQAVGGPIDTAVATLDGARWVQRKVLTASTPGATSVAV